MESMMWVNKYHTPSSAWGWTWTTEVVSGALLRYVYNEAAGFVRFSCNSAQRLRCFRISRMCLTFVLIKIILCTHGGGLGCVCMWCIFLGGKPHNFTTKQSWPSKKMTHAEFLWPATLTCSGQVWAIKLTWLWSEKLFSWFKESYVDCWYNHSLQCCSHTVLSLCPALFWLLVATY